MCVLWGRLWEIFTIGEHPYANMSAAEVVIYVKNGGILSHPDYCSADV